MLTDQMDQSDLLNLIEGILVSANDVKQLELQLAELQKATWSYAKTYGKENWATAIVKIVSSNPKTAFDLGKRLSHFPGMTIEDLNEFRK